MSYRVSWWDHDPEGWRLESEAPTLWALRPAIRELLGRGFDDPSILVERIDPPD